MQGRVLHVKGNIIDPFSRSLNLVVAVSLPLPHLHQGWIKIVSFKFPAAAAAPSPLRFPCLIAALLSVVDVQPLVIHPPHRHPQSVA